MSKKTTKKKTSSTASAFTSVAAQLLLRRGGRDAANSGDSIEFFSDLPKRQPEPRCVPGQTERAGPGRREDGRGTARRRGSSAVSDELLSSEIGKHDYDWLLTPPASPLRSRATSSSGHHQVSITAASQLRGPGSASFAKSESRVGRTTATGRKEKEKATPRSRLARSSSAAQPASTNTPAIASAGGHLTHIRTMSSASVSSINSSRSNASVISTPSLVSAASSPSTSVTARSTARPCRRDRAASGNKQPTGPAVAPARQPWALSSSKSSPRKPAPTFSRRREHAPPSSGASSPRSTTTSTTCPPTPSKRANAVSARSRLASQSSSVNGSANSQASSCPAPATSQPRRDVRLTRGARAPAVLPSASSNQQRWRQSLGPAIAAARSLRGEGSVENGSPGKISAADMATTRRPSTAAAAGGGLARTGSRPKSANTNAGGPRQDAHKRAGAAAAHHRKPAAFSQQQWSSRSAMSSASRIGLITRTASEASSAGSIIGGGGHRVAPRAAAAKVVSGPDVFPSARYDAMLLREDPRNLTWLRGCDEGEDGMELVGGSLEPFDVATGHLGSPKRSDGDDLNLVEPI